MKWIGLLALLALMSLAFASQTTADGKDIAVAMKAVAPYMKMQKDYTVVFDESAARKAGIDAATAAVGRDYAAFHNPLMASIRKNGIYDAKPDPVLAARFEPFFQYVAETGDIGLTAVTAARAESLLFSSEPKTLRKVLFQTACGGGRSRPHSCPARAESGVYRNTLADLSSYLRSNGFQITRPPGCGYGCTTDFTRWVNAYSCSWGSFRTQANARQVGNRWTYSTQTPEPNPEIFHYIWPAYPWWGSYVQWWHQSYC